MLSLVLVVIATLSVVGLLGYTRYFSRVSDGKYTVYRRYGKSEAFAKIVCLLGTCAVYLVFAPRYGYDLVVYFMELETGEWFAGLLIGVGILGVICICYGCILFELYRSVAQWRRVHLHRQRREGLKVVYRHPQNSERQA